MAKTLFMETTQITAEKTAGEIMATLVSSGARQIALDYDAGRISGLSFVLPVNGLHLLFKLPSRVEPVFKVLNERRPAETWQRGNQKDWAERDRQQAERVAWRQLLRWLWLQQLHEQVRMGGGAVGPARSGPPPCKAATSVLGGTEPSAPQEVERQQAAVCAG